jgi:ribosomal protein L7/L12
MNIEQMLRDAIERKTAKILKEEYGIEMSKEIADKLSEDDQDCRDYQIRLTNVGDHKIRVVKVVFNNMDVDLKTAKALVDQAPCVISPCLTFERATEIVKLLNDAGATTHVEKIGCDDDPLDWTPIPPDEQGDQDDQDEQPVYQVTLLEAGANREDLIKFIANARMIEPSYAEALVDHVPSVIVRDFTKKAAMTIVDELAKLNASAMLERTVFINGVYHVSSYKST